MPPLVTPSVNEKMVRAKLHPYSLLAHKGHARLRLRPVLHYLTMPCQSCTTAAGLLKTQSFHIAHDTANTISASLSAAYTPGHVSLFFSSKHGWAHKLSYSKPNAGTQRALSARRGPRDKRQTRCCIRNKTLHLLPYYTGHARRLGNTRCGRAQ